MMGSLGSLTLGGGGGVGSLGLVPYPWPLCLCGSWRMGTGRLGCTMKGLGSTGSCSGGLVVGRVGMLERLRMMMMIVMMGNGILVGLVGGTGCVGGGGTNFLVVLLMLMLRLHLVGRVVGMTGIGRMMMARSRIRMLMVWSCMFLGLIADLWLILGVRLPVLGSSLIRHLQS